MVYLAIALVVVATLCALDLMLTLAVLRRLRDRSSAVPVLTKEGGISVGTVVAPFSTRCSEGVRLTERDLTDGAVVSFFTPGCQPCRDKLPLFVEKATALQGRRQVIAVVVSGRGEQQHEEEAREMTEQLASMARVVREEPDGPCTTAFGVSAFPSQFAVSAPDGEPPTVAAVGDSVLTAVPAGRA
ncbi:TlpA family protein disulfide reductase [Streptomyces sp. NPDC007920]|uniref:TlpA family protein disulfide reductase n=1 Tax=unclassified Streptomyces TaxID=2593676 RepID=UPI0036E96483